MKRFEGKTAIVTGAGRGIGLAVAERLVSEGARVVITGRTRETRDQAVAGLGGPAHALGVPGKADDLAHQADTVRQAIEAFGSVDLLVHNTGITPAYGPMIELDLAAARKIVEINCLATLSWTQAVHDAWMKEHGGAVVNVSSVLPERVLPGLSARPRARAADRDGGRGPRSPEAITSGRSSIP